MKIKISRFEVVLSLLSLVCLSIVIFSNILPSPLGGYAEQRFTVVLLSGILFILSSLIILFSQRVSLLTISRALAPVCVLSLAFLVLSLPFLGKAFLWAEPGMYIFYFSAIVISGMALKIIGNVYWFAINFIVLVAVMSFFYGAMSINVYLFSLFDDVTSLVHFIPVGFVNIRYWSHIASWFLPLLPLAAMLGPWTKSSLWQGLVALGAGLWWWIIFLSTARGSIVGIGLGVIMAVFFFGRQSIPWLKILFVHFLTGIGLWLLLSVVVPHLLVIEESQIRTLSTHSSGRSVMFIEAWHMSVQNFPLGMGPQSWLTHEPFTEAYSDSVKFGHPHNMYLMWAAEYGWLLFVAIGCLLVQITRNFSSFRKNLLASDDGEKKLLGVGFTASVSAALSHAGVSSVFIAPGSMLVGLFVLIIFWALITPRSQIFSEGGVGSNIGKKQTVLGLAFVGVISIAWGLWVQKVWNYYDQMREDEASYYTESSQGSFPRFWLHGNFPRE